MGLQQFEQRLERLVEGALAKAFRGELQPIELGRRLTREMDLHRSVAVRGLVAPNVFEVVLSREDYERFGGFVEVLSRELAEAAREHARAERYSFPGPVAVTIGWNGELSKNTFAVSGTFLEGEDPVAGYLVLEDGTRVEVSDETVTIGRLEDCRIPILDSNVSRRHAELRRDNDSVVVVDLASTNGTRVNGVLITQSRLSDGDVITVGKTSMRFESS